MSKFGRFVLALLILFMLPAWAYAQGQIAGIVKDTSGAVLPGVTVEAASPALIEKVRSVVTDGTGRYRVVDLRPGAYTVTFTLTGFATVKRDGIVLTGSAVVVVDADLKVGAVEETITVSGETPIVDVQSVTRQQVLSDVVIDAVPTSRNYEGLAKLLPGVTSGSPDQGGVMGSETTSLTFHGARTTDVRVTLNGISTMTLQAGGAIGGSNPDVSTTQEVTLDTNAVSAELATGGMRINFVPRDGGNTFKASIYGTFSHENLQGDNLTQRLQDAGLPSADKMWRNWDVNPAFGGPIRKDRVWYWMSIRNVGVDNFAPIFENKNAWDPTAWTYVPDPSKPGDNNGRWWNSNLRTTWQATPRNKIAGTYRREWWCRCPTEITATVAPEASNDRRFPRLTQEHLEWTSPVTNRLMLEVVGMHLFERWGRMHLQDAGSLHDPKQLAAEPLMIAVTEQSTGLLYRMRPSFNNAVVPNFAYRAAASYVPGAHAFKFGWNMTHGYLNMTTYDFQPISYRVTGPVANGGVPNQLTERATPYTALSNEDNDMGLFAQDRWTVNRATVSLALRYDYFGTSFPEQHLGPGPLVPTRDLTFPAQDNLHWKDITYRTGVSYDLRGNGKTAVKVTLGKYLLGQTLNGLGSSPNPFNALALSTTRTWTDANGNFKPDCNLLNGAAQDLRAGGGDFCGVWSNTSFGKTVPQDTFDPNLLGGWGNRQYNWEFTTAVQHEILPRVSVDLGYFRRIWGNFQVTDNLAVGPADFNYFSITTPANANLPNGGGSTLSGLRDVTPTLFGQTRNYNTLSDTIGKQTEHWNGVDLNVSARLQNGLLVQGGFSTGRTMTDNCEIVAKLPEMQGVTVTGVTGSVVQSLQFCHQESPFLTQVKGYAVYTIPRVDVQIAGTFYSYPGPEINPVYNAPNAVVSPSLGRTIAGGSPNMAVSLVQPQTMYGDRRNYVDLRFGKILHVGRSRANVSLDLYNVANADSVLTINNNFGAWRASQPPQPTSNLLARFAKVTVQFDF